MWRFSTGMRARVLPLQFCRFLFNSCQLGNEGMHWDNLPALRKPVRTFGRYRQKFLGCKC